MISASSGNICSRPASPKILCNAPGTAGQDRRRQAAAHRAHHPPRQICPAPESCISPRAGTPVPGSGCPPSTPTAARPECAGSAVAQAGGLGGGRVAEPGRTLCSRSRCTVSCVQTAGRSAAVLGRLHSASERCTQTAPPIARAHVSGWQMVGERWVCRADRGGRTPRPPARPGGGPAAALSSQQAHLAGGAAGIQPPLPPTPLAPSRTANTHPPFTLPPRV